MSKPIIRHCRNCKYCEEKRKHFDVTLAYCTVKYKTVEFERLAALTCKHYEVKKEYTL